MSPTGPSRLGSSIAVLPAPVQSEPVKGTFLLCSKVTFSYCCDIAGNRLLTKADNFRCYQQQCGTEAIRCGSRLSVFGSYGRANPHGLSDTNPDVFRQWHDA